MIMVMEMLQLLLTGGRSVTSWTARVWPHRGGSVCSWPNCSTRTRDSRPPNRVNIDLIQSFQSDKPKKYLKRKEEYIWLRDPQSSNQVDQVFWLFFIFSKRNFNGWLMEFTGPSFRSMNGKERKRKAPLQPPTPRFAIPLRLPPGIGNNPQEEDDITNEPREKRHISDSSTSTPAASYCDGVDDIGCYQVISTTTRPPRMNHINSSFWNWWQVRLYYDWFLVPGSCKCWKQDFFTKYGRRWTCSRHTHTHTHTDTHARTHSYIDICILIYMYLSVIFCLFWKGISSFACLRFPIGDWIQFIDVMNDFILCTVGNVQHLPSRNKIFNSFATQRIECNFPPPSSNIFNKPPGYDGQFISNVLGINWWISVSGMRRPTFLLFIQQLWKISRDTWLVVHDGNSFDVVPWFMITFYWSFIFIDKFTWS